MENNSTASKSGAQVRPAPMRAEREKARRAIIVAAAADPKSIAASAFALLEIAASLDELASGTSGAEIADSIRGLIHPVEEICSVMPRGRRAS